MRTFRQCCRTQKSLKRIIDSRTIDAQNCTDILRLQAGATPQGDLLSSRMQRGNVEAIHHLKLGGLIPFLKAGSVHTLKCDFNPDAIEQLLPGAEDFVLRCCRGEDGDAQRCSVTLVDKASAVFVILPSGIGKQSEGIGEAFFCRATCIRRLPAFREGFVGKMRRESFHPRFFVSGGCRSRLMLGISKIG